MSRELGVQFARDGRARQRAVPRAGEHPAAAGAVRQGRRARRAPAGARADGPLRRAGGDGRTPCSSSPPTSPASSPPAPSWSTAASPAPTSPRCEHGPAPIPLIGLTTYREQAAWGVWEQRADLLHSEYADAVVAAGGVPVLLPPAVGRSGRGRRGRAPARRAGGQRRRRRRPGPLRRRSRTRAPPAGAPDRDAWELALLDAAEAAGLPGARRVPGHAADGGRAPGAAWTSTPPTWSATTGTPPAGRAFGDDRRSSTEAGSRVRRPARARASASTATTTSRCASTRASSRRPTPRTAPLEAMELPGDRFCLAVQWHPEVAPTELCAGARAGRCGDVAPALRHWAHGASRQTDILGAPYTVETIVLGPDAEGAVEANLVRLPGGAADPPGGAARARVLRLLLPHRVRPVVVATVATTSTPWTCASTAGRCGSTTRPGYVEDCAEYFEELDEAWARITGRDGHDHVSCSARTRPAG